MRRVAALILLSTGLPLLADSAFGSCTLDSETHSAIRITER